MSKSLNILNLFVFIFLANLANAQDLGQLGKKPDKDFIKLNGSLNLGAWVYNANGIENRANPYSWYISGSPTLSVAGFAMPFTATISEQERNFSQPFNQVGVSPYYKWFKLHLGYRNLAFSDYSLAGATFLGVGAELNPGKLRVAGFYGRFRRAVELDTSLGFTALPSYRRTGYGGKIGFGSNVNYVDLSFIKSSDDPNSIANPLTAPIAPEDNLVIGLKSQVKLAKRITFGVDVAASAITTNKTFDTLDLGTDVSSPILSGLTSLIALNSSTVLKFAGGANAAYAGKKAGLRLSGRYVDAGYISHGANFIQDDIIQYLASPFFNLFKGRLNVNLSGGLQQNNLDNTKTFTTVRKIGSVNLNMRPLKRLMVNLNYANYGTTRQSGFLQLNDSIQFSLINSSIGANINFQVPTKKNAHAIVLTFQQNGVSDRNELTREFTASDIIFTNLAYSLSITKLRLNSTLGINYSTIENFSGKTQARGVTASLAKSFFKDLMRVSLSANYQNRTLDGSTNGYILNNNVDVSYRFFKKHNIGVGFTTTKNTTNVAAFRAFNEQRFRLNYGFTF